MFLYLTLGTNDLDRARRFYDAVLPVLGLELRVVNEHEAGYGNPGDSNDWFYVTKPYNSQPASHGNGAMTAILAENRAAVDAFYNAALTFGGADEGAPGLRPYHPSFYACYVRDPDGNKLSVVCEKPE